MCESQCCCCACRERSSSSSSRMLSRSLSTGPSVDAFDGARSPSRSRPFLLSDVGVASAGGVGV